jgi:hypothetical protein
VPLPHWSKMIWTDEKNWLSAATGLDGDVLHLNAGLALLVFFALLSRRAPWHWAPWLGVLAIELANETYDLIVGAPGEGTVNASIHDVWITMLWPTVILIVFPWFARRDRDQSPE